MDSPINFLIGGRPVERNIPHYDWVSLGGGAAGYFGAINYAGRRVDKGSPASVLILESSSKVLSKVKISGGGRCNLTHRCFDPRKLAENYPRGLKELLSVFSKFQPRDTISWFENRGVSLKAEEDGRIFPVTDVSQTIIDCLELERKKLGVELRFRVALRKIEKIDDLFLLEIDRGEYISANHVLIATGSNQKMWEMVGILGHKIVHPVPSLFSFNIQDQRLKGLSGRDFGKVEIKGHVGNRVVNATGPLLITHWGLSGPSVLKLSSLLARDLFDVNYQFQIHINFFPDLDEEKVLKLLQKHQNTNAQRMLKNAVLKPFPRSYWVNLLAVLGFDPKMPWAEVSKDMRTRILQEVRTATFEVLGKTTNKEEFVTAGGVELKEVDFRSMQSRHVPGMYFAGEVLNIDGLTGGFNFQNAWSTSFVAANSASDSETPE